MEKTQDQKLNNKAEQAETLAKQFPEEVKIAAEAMKRTMRYRNARAVYTRHYAYTQIF